MTAAQALNYGSGAYGPADTVELDARLMTFLEEFLATRRKELPRPPALALEIIALSRRPTAQIAELAALLQREPVLAARVLRLANSTLYGPASSSVTLEQALRRMGPGLMRDVVLEAAMQMTIIHAEGFTSTVESIRRHSCAVAWISRFVARHTPLEAENAFMLGLVHDVGLSVSLLGVSEYLARQRQPLRLSPESWSTVEAMHERFSEVVLQSWGLPSTVTSVAQHHHALMPDGVVHPHVAVLIVAEQIASDAGCGIRPQLEGQLVLGSERAAMAQTDLALQALTLTRRHFDTISADMKRVLDTLDGPFHKK